MSPAPKRSKETAPHRWQFRARFRRGAFGWRSQPAVQRVREAVREIQRVAKKDPLLAGEGAVLFLERVAPAIEGVDSSSGSIGTAVNHAVRDLALVLEDAPADEARRIAWLSRLFLAYEDDEMPYLEQLGDEWGRVCASAAIASRWADGLLDAIGAYFKADRKGRGYLKEATPCLSALFAAGRYEELIDLLRGETFWPYKRWEVKALASLGRVDDALSLAESCRGPWTSDLDADALCEEILLAAGRSGDAYRLYAFRATAATSNIAAFREIARRYPQKQPGEILHDLVAASPGDEGNWFATAKSLGLYDEAVALVQRSPCDPRTLIRAARDFERKEPGFALEAGIAALRWIADGEGYEIDAPDVYQAHDHATKAAANAGREGEVRERIRQVILSGSQADRHALRFLRERLGIA